MLTSVARKQKTKKNIYIDNINFYTFKTLIRQVPRYLYYIRLYISTFVYIYSHHMYSNYLQMIVEEMNILTTVFLRYDNEKIYYPNAVLLTRPISNFYRSPEMSDAIDFTIDVTTPIETIIALKKSIQM